MENIVYILGAGFSAPLGLPVMSNFLEKSKDQFIRDPERFAYFQEVFDAIDRLHKAKSYYTTNLFNIEDILSMLEFQTQLGDHKAIITRDKFIQYVLDVIKFHTPEQALLSSGLFYGNDLWSDYVKFAISLLYCPYVEQVHISNSPRGPENIIPVDQQQLKYSLVTLNYDMTFETIQRHMERFMVHGSFERPGLETQTPYSVSLAKLHGSVDEGQIIPPTWNKTLQSTIADDWKVAYKALSEANQIRIIGYSLPETDTYIKFLLRSTVVSAPNLRAIDVICLDHDGNTQKRYGAFITHPSYRFRSAHIGDFFRRLRNKGDIRERLIEDVHQEFMN